MASPNPPQRAKKPAGSSLLARPWRWLKLLFVTPLRMKRRGSHLQMVFEDTAYLAGQAQSRPGVVPAADVSLQGMRTALKELLDQHGDTRRVMRHLGLVESTLKRSGTKAIDELPAEVLKAAALQLESLAGGRSTPGLAELRSHLTVVSVAAGAPAEPEERDEAAGNKLSDFCNSKRMQVRELTDLAFEDMTKSWLGRQPDMLPAAAQGKAGN